MLSIKGSISAASADSYYQKDDYYLKEGGKWQGLAAKKLNVEGGISKEEFVLALQGKDMNGKQLIAKTDGVFDPNHKHYGKDRAAIDLTFSAPKSVSILGFSDAAIKEAHDIAVTQTLKRVEALSAQTREQTGGKREVVPTGNLAIAKFDHSVSRSLDPQLHTHCVIMNMTQKENGSWRALETTEFFRNKMDYGLLYRNELAHELTKRGIAIEVTDRQQGFFEIKGVDQNVIEYFSKRSEEIEKRVKELREKGEYSNADDARLKEIAALGSRSAKPEEMRKEEIKKIVKQGIESQGYQYATYYDEIKQSWPEHRLEKQSLTETLDNALSLATDSEAIFKESKILKETARLSLGNFSQTEIQQCFREKADVITLGRGGDGVMYYTTKAMYTMEKDIVRRVNDARGQYTPQVTADAVRKHLDHYEQKYQFAFTQGQRDAALTVLANGDRVNIIQGDAGTGKTAYLRQVKQITEKNGCQVFGIGFTGKAAAEIRIVGIESMTIDSFLNRNIEIVGPGEKAMSEKSLAIRQGAILIMDEASMTGIKHFDQLLKLVETKELKLVIQGDNKQLPSLSAGRMHDILYQQAFVAKVNLNEIVRQRAPVIDRNGREKEPGSNAYYTVQTMQKKGIAAALETMTAQGNITEIKDRFKRLEAIKEVP